MHPVLAKTFGGLSREYYLRHFLFGLIFPILIIWASVSGPPPHELTVATIGFCVVNTILYPYSRFVYESIVGFVMGGNVFFVNAFMLLFAKLITMMLCWFLAVFIAPLGLGYLYYRHSKT